MKKQQGLLLSKLTSNGMVLRRGDKTNIWGISRKEEKIKVVFLGEEQETLADSEGRWSITLHNLSPGGPYEMQIMSGMGEEVILKDILIGDVWLCSGQSNMELPMNRVRDRYPEDMHNCTNNKLRIFKVDEKYNFHSPIEELESGSWQAAGENTIGNFSALSYYFAKYMFEASDVPVGIINVSLGGSPIQSWMSEEMLRDFTEYTEDIERHKNDGYIEEELKKNERLQNEWYNSLREKDKGLQNKELSWYSQDLCEEGWDKIMLPVFFREAGLKDFTGSLWFRKRVEHSEAMAEEEAFLWLGTIVDSDETYVNGKLVGVTPYQYPPRKYKIPKGLLKAGENLITLRVVCDAGNGRFTPGKIYSLFGKGGNIDLKGSWKYKIGTGYVKKPEINFISWKPAGLYNGMLAPCHNYAITGVLWYQGESNTREANNYQTLFQKLIMGLREKWEQRDFPFLFVQLPNFEIDIPEGDYGWPLLREAQRQALSLPNTAMVVAIDLGEDNDIHPLGKKELAYRLSLGARALALGEQIEYSGPLPIMAEQKGKEVVLTFSHTGRGLLTKSDLRPGNFELAGKEKYFIKTTAEIRDNQIILAEEDSNRQERTPVFEYVRYAFVNSPKEELLYNTENLPASPFEMRIKQT